MNKKPIGVFNDLKTLALHPLDFFTKVAPEKKFKNVILFDLVQSYIGTLPLIIYLLIVSLVIMESPEIPKSLIIFGVVILSPLGLVVLSFISSFFSFIILKIAGGKGSYFSTYRAQVYSSFPSAVGTFLFFMGGQLLSIYSIVLQIIGFSKAHKVSYLKGAIPFITFTIFIILIVLTGFVFLFSQIDNYTEPPGELEWGGAIMGERILDLCIPKRDNIFLKNDKMCIQPINVTGFEKGTDELNWFDMTYKIRNSSGDLVAYSTNIFGEYGHILLADNILNDQWFSLDLDTFDPGVYTYELAVEDKVSKKQALINTTFVLKRGDVGTDYSSSALLTDTLEEGMVAEYVLGDILYEVKVLDIGGSPLNVKLDINGQITPWLQENDKFDLIDDNTKIIIADILSSSEYGNEAVKFHLIS